MLRNKLYRSLLKLGKTFDKNPRYKALIFTSEARFPKYTFDFSERHSSVEMESNIDKAMEYLVDKVCGDGVFYKPSVSLTDVVREGFRKPWPAEMSEMEQHQLAFMAMRFLFNCQRLSNEMSSSHPLHYSEVMECNTANTIVSIEHAVPSIINGETTHQNLFNPDKPLLTTQSTIKPGSLLLSHPLHLQSPLKNAVILVTEVTDSNTVGLILNREMPGIKFKETLSRKERILSGSFLSPFYDCTCFIGGTDAHVAPHNCTVLHQNEILAPFSTRVNLGDLDIFGEEPCISDKMVSESATNFISKEPKNFVYMSTDLKSIAAELEKGTVSKNDLKLVLGISNWPESDLLEEVEANKYFLAQHVAHAQAADVAERIAAASNIVDYHDLPSTEEIENLRRKAADASVLIADIVMAKSNENGTDVVADEETGWLHINKWESGAYAWCKALLYMGGEYQDISRLHMLYGKLATFDKKDTCVSLLRTMNEYGTKRYEDSDGSDSDSDYDFDNSDSSGSDVEDSEWYKEKLEQPTMTVKIEVLFDKANNLSSYDSDFEDSDDDDDDDDDDTDPART